MTLAIFNTGHEYPPLYSLIPGNYKEWDKLTIKSNISDDQKVDDFLDLMYSKVTGRFKFKIRAIFPILHMSGVSNIIVINIIPELLESNL